MSETLPGSDRTPARILVIEDEAGGACGMSSLLRARPAAQVETVRGTGAALSHLRGLKERSEKPRPQLVLLDLASSRDREPVVLTALKEDPELCRIPVVVLSQAAAEADVRRCYEMHANSYVVCPDGEDHARDAAHAIATFWLDVAQLPPP